jgi:hypothetical protein
MSIPRAGSGAAVVLFFVIASSVSAPASAQYFGRNKVQYREFKFEVLKTEHFDIYFYPSEREGVDIAARLAERWNTRLERVLRHQLRGRQPLVLYGSHTDFEQTTVIGGEIGEGTGGVTEPLRRRIVLPLGGPLADTDHVIGHELVHAFQFDMTTTPEAGPGETGASRLPLWFVEGMAEYLSLGPVDPGTAMWLRDAVRQDELPAIKDLDNPKYFPYRWGHALWAYISGRWGDEVIGQLLASAPSPGGIDAAFEKVLGVKTAELSSAWQSSIRERYGPILAATIPPGESGHLIVKGREFGGELNVGPAISPDGQWVAFLSERGLFSIDLYVADRASGKTVKKLTSTATSPHYSSIQFIYSAGAWDRESRQLAVATTTGGRAALAIFDVSSGKVLREVPISGVDEIFNPTWAPDGHAIGFTGMTRGLTDLFVHDLNTGATRRLTNDPYADLQPAWSPDGRRLAFATDRFSSDLKSLDIGDYRLAVIDLETGAIERVAADDRGKQINPQWSPDGRSLYLISDRDGIPNVYRVTPGAGRLTRITDIGTGVSGITRVSPAMSVASQAGVIAFSAYEDGGYSLYWRDEATPTRPRASNIEAAALPPADRRPSQVAALLGDARLGLPEPIDYPTEPYRPRLALEGIAQPMVGVGVSRFGTTLGGGLSVYFGDMLQRHSLATAVDVNSGIGGNFSGANVGAQAAYLNQTHRWNWGLAGGQVPYLSGGFSSEIARTPNGDLIEIDELFIFRQTERSATGVIAYPFDRSRRVEVQGGATHISFDQVVNTQVFSLVTGALFEDSTVTTPLGRSMTLANSSAAYVFDTSAFGATSPVQGQRYRLEASPTFGTVNFTSVLADYRRYFMPAPFYTLAFRALHYGRYGSGGEDDRLFPLYIGYPSLVRGYDVTSFDASECPGTDTASCPALDRLLGSRMLIGNVEFRFPLLRPFGVSRSMYGPVPVEVALFADMGTAWSSGDTPAVLGGSRDGVASAGISFRASLFGFAVGEFAFARPFQRPGRGWEFGFNLAPGW